VEWTAHPHLAPRLKKEWRYISTSPLGFSDLFWGEFYLYFALLYVDLIINLDDQNMAIYEIANY